SDIEPADARVSTEPTRNRGRTNQVVRLDDLLRSSQDLERVQRGFRAGCVDRAEPNRRVGVAHVLFSSHAVFCRVQFAGPIRLSELGSWTVLGQKVLGHPTARLEPSLQSCAPGALIGACLSATDDDLEHCTGLTGASR